MFSLRDRLVAYFAQAPEEEVTVEDLRRKLGFASGSVLRAVIHEARDAGWLCVVERRKPLDRREVEHLVTTTPEARDFFRAPLANAKDLQK